MTAAASDPTSELCRHTARLVNSAERQFWMASLPEFQGDVVFCLSATRAVVPDDLNDQIEQGRTLAHTGGRQLLRHASAVGWVARLKYTLVALCHCFMAKPHSGHAGVLPTQDEASVRCTEASAQDVVERVEVAPPGVVREELRELDCEAVEVDETRAVDDQDRALVSFRHARRMPARSQHVNSAERQLGATWEPTRAGVSIADSEFVRTTRVTCVGESPVILARRIRVVITVGVVLCAIGLLVTVWTQPDAVDFAGQTLLGSLAIILFCSYLVYVLWKVYR